MDIDSLTDRHDKQTDIQTAKQINTDGLLHK